MFSRNILCIMEYILWYGICSIVRNIFFVTEYILCYGIGSVLLDIFSFTEYIFCYELYSLLRNTFMLRNMLSYGIYSVTECTPYYGIYSLFYGIYYIMGYIPYYVIYSLTKYIPLVKFPKCRNYVTHSLHTHFIQFAHWQMSQNSDPWDIPNVPVRC